VYPALIAEFSRQCCARIAGGEKLSDREFAAFRTLLAARELGDRRLLGPLAGPDASFDTVTGRCGLGPGFTDH
jgi:hypothetical protein